MGFRRSVQRQWGTADLLPTAAGLVAGSSLALNHFAELPAPALPGRQLLGGVLVGALIGAVGLLISHRRIIAWCIRRDLVQAPALPSLRMRQAATYFVFLLFAAGATGFRLPGAAFPLSVLALFVCLNVVVIAFASRGGDPSTSPVMLAALFFVSGIAALVYQVTWQRALHACFGVNIESATIIVTIFMFGLGIGSIVGGFISRAAGTQGLIKAFLACELLVGVFGVASIPLIRFAGGLTVAASLPATALIVFALLSIPTLMMGATLPLLVSYAHRKLSHVGQSVGLLYCVNTLGSALACYLTADVLFVIAGEQAATLVAACFNFAVSFVIYRLLRVEPVAQVHSPAEAVAVARVESAP
jgi:hypothetical protein